MTTKHMGSCLCGTVNFEINGEFESFFLCHCKYCQKDTGSAHAANLFSTKAKIKLLTGEDKLKTYNLPSTKHTKSFCTECGSALPNLQMNGSLLVVPAGCLDTSLSIVPKAHIFLSSKADWDTELDAVEKIQKFPDL